jgi:hypothetical protein
LDGEKLMFGRGRSPQQFIVSDVLTCLPKVLETQKAFLSVIQEVKSLAFLLDGSPAALVNHVSDQSSENSLLELVPGKLKHLRVLNLALADLFPTSLNEKVSSVLVQHLPRPAVLQKHLEALQCVKLATEPKCLSNFFEPPLLLGNDSAQISHAVSEHARLLHVDNVLSEPPVQFLLPPSFDSLARNVVSQFLQTAGLQVVLLKTLHLCFNKHLTGAK